MRFESTKRAIEASLGGRVQCPPKAFSD